jgi:hypothetical protein
MVLLGSSKIVKVNSPWFLDGRLLGTRTHLDRLSMCSVRLFVNSLPSAFFFFLATPSILTIPTDLNCLPVTAHSTVDSEHEEPLQVVSLNATSVFNQLRFVNGCPHDEQQCTNAHTHDRKSKQVTISL